MSKGGHNLQTAVLKCALTNTEPNAASDTVWNTSVAPEPASANGYTSGGNTLTTVSATTVSGNFTLVVDDSVFTASGGSIGPFQFAIIYNSSASNKIIGYYDYSSSITLTSGSTLTVDADPINGLISIPL